MTVAKDSNIGLVLSNLEKMLSKFEFISFFSLTFLESCFLGRLLVERSQRLGRKEGER